MGDYQCNYCNDRGDCDRCSYFFQPEKVHRACGFKWKDHPVRQQGDAASRAVYPPWAECPKAKGKGHE
jgi:hypothetical protein